MNKPHDVRASRTTALDQLLELVVLLNQDATTSLARDGLTIPRAHLLWLLHHGGPTTQRALADALKVTPRNVTGLVDALVATGFVTREPHPTDRRAILVSLTARGAAAMTQMARSHAELAGLLFGDMAGRQFDAFAGGLEHVLACLRGALAAPRNDG